MSLFESHLGVRLSQVLIHLGTTVGQEVPGTVPEPGLEPAGDLLVGAGVLVASHLGQMVDVVVRVSVETVLYTEVISEEPDVMVAVTGQVVTVSTVTTVVVVSSGEGKVTAGVETGEAPYPVGEIGAGEVPAAAVDWVTAPTPDEPGLAGVETGAGEETAEGEDSAGGEGTVVSVTGQIVVDIAMVEVTTTVECAGQDVTSGAQLVTVIKLVVNTVEVVN